MRMASNSLPDIEAAPLDLARLIRERRRLRSRIVHDFFYLELLASLRLEIGLHAFKRLVVSGVVIAATSVAGAVGIAATVMAAYAGRSTSSANHVALLVVVVSLYFGLVYLFLQVLTRRRFVVSMSPNRDLFRCLDIAPATVYWTYVGLRAAPLFSTLGLCGIAVTIALGSTLHLSAASAIALIATPVAVLLLSLAMSAVVAVTTGAKAIRTMQLLSFLCVIAAFLTGVFGDVVLGNGQPTGEQLNISRDSEDMLLTGIAVVATIVILLASVILIMALRRLDANPFPVDAVEEGRLPRLVSLSGRGRGESLTEVLRAEWANDSGRILVRGTLFGLFLALIALAGAHYSGQFVAEYLASAHGGVVAIAVAYGVGLSTVELLCRNLGPAALSFRLRFLWENGWSATRIVACVLRFYLGTALMLTALLTALTFLIGRAISLQSLAVIIIVFAAALISDTLIAPTRNVDASSTSSTAGALITLAASAPGIAILVFAFPYSELVAFAYSIALLGGAFACWILRIRRLP